MNQPKEQVGVPEAAIRAAEDRLIGENPPGTKAWHDQTRVEIRATLDAALPAIEQAVEERVRERLLSDEAVDAVTGYMEWPRDGFVGDTTAWRKAHARAALERLAAALCQPDNTEEENDEG